MTFGSAFVATASATPGVSASSIIVVLSLRGAADGLSLVVPHGDRTYYKARPTIAVPRGSLLAQDDTFGLHPALRPLLPMWKAGKLGAVHATGHADPQPLPLRRHGGRRGRRSRVGCAHRMAQPARRDPAGQRRRSAASASARAATPTSLYGPVPVMSVTDLGKIQVAGAEPARGPPRRASPLAGHHVGRRGHRAGCRRPVRPRRQHRAAAQPPAAATPAPRTPPRTSGRRSPPCPGSLKADTGTSLVTVDQGDWDHHTGVGTRHLRPHAQQHHRPRHVGRRLLRRPRTARRQGHARHDERVRPPHRRERPAGPRPRVGQRDVPRRGRGQGRSLLRQVAGPRHGRSTRTSR